MFTFGPLLGVESSTLGRPDRTDLSSVKKGGGGVFALPLRHASRPPGQRQNKHKTLLRGIPQHLRMLLNASPLASSANGGAGGLHEVVVFSFLFLPK